MKDEQAFPFDELNQQTGCVAVQHAGMTLRDYFAIHATAQDIQRFLHAGLTRAQARYAFADAMLKAREAK